MEWKSDFKTTLFGGFDRQSVLERMEEMKAEYEAEQQLVFIFRISDMIRKTTV